MPLTRIPIGRLRYLVVPAFVTWLLAFVPFMVIGKPEDLVRLQLAGSEPRAGEIVGTWSDAEAIDMAYLQGLDHVHPLAYGLLLAAAAVWAGRALRGRAAQWAPVMAWMAVAGALSDVVENIGMILMIRGHVDAPVPTITTTFALAKYSLGLVVSAYVVAGFVARVRGPRPVAGT